MPGYHTPFRLATGRGWARPELSSPPLSGRPVRAQSLDGAIVLEEPPCKRRRPMTQTEEWREQARQPDPPVDYFVVETNTTAW